MKPGSIILIFVVILGVSFSTRIWAESSSFSKPAQINVVPIKAANPIGTLRQTPQYQVQPQTATASATIAPVPNYCQNASLVSGIGALVGSGSPDHLGVNGRSLYDFGAQLRRLICSGEADFRCMVDVEAANPGSIDRFIRDAMTVHALSFAGQTDENRSTQLEIFKILMSNVFKEYPCINTPQNLGLLIFMRGTERPE